MFTLKGKSYLLFFLLILGLFLSATIRVSLADPGKEKEMGSSPKRFSMEFRNADIQDLLRLLAKEEKLNIIPGEDVKGTVSVSFTNVTVWDALDAILKNLGYSYIKEDNIIRIVSKPQLVSRTFILESASGEGLEAQLTKFLSGEGKIVVNKEQNSLMVVDFPENVDRISQYVQMIDLGQRQVMIEAKIVEINLDREQELGINWTWADPDFSGWSGLTGTVSQSLSASTNVFNLTAGNNHITAGLQAMINEGKANLLSAPRVATMDGEQATIKVLKQIPYVKTVTSYESGIPIVTEEVEFRKAGITLEVTPQITPTGFIKMKIHPKIDQLTGWTETTDPQPIIDTREAETQVRVKNGQTIILGGLLTDNNKNTAKKVPFLGDIPILGFAFRHTKKTNEKIELLIFITPRILTEGNIETVTKEGEKMMERRKNED
ncbi:MAG: hypothetical protein GXO98_06520 [Nitrospirae bacterium]|nr:hypothetical protein [Nitrospirota bacterium]